MRPILIIICSVMLSSVAWGQSAQPTSAPARGKQLEFDGFTIEGMNKKPAEYQSTIKKRRDESGHVYSKMISFGIDLEESLREMRYLQ